MKKIIFLITMLLVGASAWSLPFKPTNDPYDQSTKWYQIQCNGTYLYSQYNNSLDVTTTPSTDDHYLFCFVGTEDTGFKIFHRSSRSFLKGGYMLGGSGNEEDINYALARANDFDIYCWLTSTLRYYIVIDDYGNLNTSYRGLSPYTAVEVEVDPIPRPIVLPYGSLTPAGFHIPVNDFDNYGYDGYAKLIDGNKNTNWTVYTPVGAWTPVWVDFKSDVSFVPTGYVLTTSNLVNSDPKRNPKEWLIYGKQTEKGEWTELVHVTDGAQAGLGSENSTDYIFNIDGVTKAYRYFRFEVRDLNAIEGKPLLQLAELQMLGNKVDALPFEPTTNPSAATTKWYLLKSGERFLYTATGENYAKVSTSPYSNDNFRWCFVGTESTGFRIYNRGLKKYLASGILLDDSESAPGIDYVELDTEDNFYIYYKNDQNTKAYLCYNSTDGFYPSLSKTTGFQAVLVDVPDPTPTVTGDVTGDGRVDVADLNGLNNIMLGKAEVTASADLTDDNSVDVADLNALINIILNISTPDDPPVDPTVQSLTVTGYSIPHNSLDNLGNEGCAKLVDGNKNTKWVVVNTSGAWEPIKLNLKSSVAFKPTSYIMTTGNDTYSFYTRNPKAWKIYGKQTESDAWTELAYVTNGAGLGTSNTTDYTFEFSGVKKAYQYYRFEVIEIGGKDKWDSNKYVFQLAELTLMGVAAQ